MSNNLSLSLIEGAFNTEEAKEVLMNIFATKIQFHDMRNFSAQERLGKEDEASLKRIPVLKNCIKEMQMYLEEANKEGVDVTINASIHISFAEKKQC
jgi:hypothetical protein